MYSYRLDSSDDAHVSGHLRAVEERAAVAHELHVHDERAQYLRQEPRVVLHVPPARALVITNRKVVVLEEEEKKKCWRGQCGM